MISAEKIDEWMREIEARPESAALIAGFIARRLRELGEQNEALLAENIQLRTEQKIEAYEARLAILERQLELLKRQLGGEALGAAGASPAAESGSIFIYNSRGETLRVELDPADLKARRGLGRFVEGGPGAGGRGAPRLLACGSQEELLFLFDSGRSETGPAAALPAAALSSSGGTLDWKQARLAEPRGAEELAAILPVGRMALAETVVQFSRRGYVKKMLRNACEDYLRRGFVGGGVTLSSDRSAGLILCAKEDRAALASQEGYVLALETGKLAYSIDEALRLAPSDRVLTGFALGQKSQVIFVTNNGKALSRQAEWLEPAGSLKARGQAVFSNERRSAGVRLVGAAEVDEGSWGAALEASGELTAFPIGELAGAGALYPGREPVEVLAFAAA